MDFELSNYIENKQSEINNALQEILLKSTIKGRLADAMTYAVMASGKRIRPILSIATGEAIGMSNSKDTLLAGCAIELIHTYSLIHDDLPAMDDDALRRGKPTCHVAFDEATAILAGDGLLTLGFDVLSDRSMHCSNDDALWMTVIQIVSKSSGSLGMVEGQMRDLMAEGSDIDLDALENIHRLKTGAMIDAAVEVGARIAGADHMQLAHLKRYAKNIGVAFQVVDDLLNVEGDPDLMGKAVGTDQERDKCTYPTLLGVAASKKKARDLIEDALQALDIFDNRSDPLRAIATYVLERNK